ncbi:MAG: triphosphoribosyl-dephospho-CoA synthase [Candidatus Bathyarchaeia archaeon]
MQRLPLTFDKATRISQCLELAVLLEVGADKPGNVNLVVGFEGTNHAHFFASAVAAAPYFKVAAERGVAVSKGEISVADVGVGLIIRDCVTEISAWQSGGNTLLGTVILFSPLAVAAGMTWTEKDVFDVSVLRQNLKRVVEATTHEDAVAVYEAVKIAKPSGLGEAPDLDVNDPNSVKRILSEKIPLYKVFEIAASYDMICAEWVNNYPVTFELAYPSLMRHIKEDGGLDTAIIHAFLTVLAMHPDTFIARKVGLEKAREVSRMAGDVLKNGGLKTALGKAKLHEFDAMLRQKSNQFNPGTTADIIAAAIAISLLGGYRP